MAEENKTQEQKPKQAAPAAAVAAQAVAQAPQTGKKKNKKISSMSLKEVEEKLSATKEKMGRMDSRYAIELLKRKDVLAGKK